MSSAHKRVTADFGIDGALSSDNLKFIKETYASVLSVCGPECGPTAFSDLQELFPGKHAAVNIPLISDLPPYTVSDPTSTPLSVEVVSVIAYKKFEAALDAMARPTAIVCKTSGRASLVLAAYLVWR